MWQALGLERIALDLNSLGGAETRRAYRATLVEYFEDSRSRLDEDSLRRLTQNPLRILDSKNPEMQPLIEQAPVMLDYLDAESAEHFGRLRELLDAAGVAYRVNPRLVRGLDYYNRTVFEWHTDALGAQGAVCSGGRYDGLVELLGGRPTPAIGWAMGVERLVALFELCGGEAPTRVPDVFIVAVGERAEAQALQLAEPLRDGRPVRAHPGRGRGDERPGRAQAAAHRRRAGERAAGGGARRARRPSRAGLAERGATRPPETARGRGASLGEDEGRTGGRISFGKRADRGPAQLVARERPVHRGRDRARRGAAHRLALVGARAG